MISTVEKLRAALAGLERRYERQYEHGRQQIADPINVHCYAGWVPEDFVNVDLLIQLAEGYAALAWLETEHREPRG